MNKWAFQSKMSFSPDLANQPQKVIFSRKTTKKIYPKIFFYDITVRKIDFQNYLDLPFRFKIFF